MQIILNLCHHDPNLCGLESRVMYRSFPSVSDRTGSLWLAQNMVFAVELVMMGLPNDAIWSDYRGSLWIYLL